MDHLLFVYGTLKRGFAHHERYLGLSQFIANVKTAEPHPLVLCSERYEPVMIDAKGHGKKVMGELYWVDDVLIDNLDFLEKVNEPDGNQRRRVEVVLPDGTSQRAWCYVKNSTLVKDIRSKPISIYEDDR
ncbi:gamma-glutamylcyclotransferase family protein [Marinobacter sp. TBZ242]|uniref:Gamma-glutamylcyclotransferase family protein n=1 Tax=Marinobacter azerbaijanicus TaxID=3050455 RepID=A0ABT7IIJ1_9GAMM|nr:gamma-glutamylcyclotransferase family protein [Marinobacter sp. TBZ242]MDL0433996.1 gamma-glutamylcyclotransferase family protein [Marinobacter sp. TBZ242]